MEVKEDTMATAGLSTELLCYARRHYCDWIRLGKSDLHNLRYSPSCSTRSRALL